MFFMMGITTGRRDLDFNQMTICSQCGQYGRYSVFMTYTVLSLFFIPCFKWNRQYYVTSSCCGATCRLNSDIGRRIERGEAVEIRPEDLEMMDNRGWRGDYRWNDGQNREKGSLIVTKRCSNCGFTTEEDYDYCPKCGQKL